MSVASLDKSLYLSRLNDQSNDILESIKAHAHQENIPIIQDQVGVFLQMLIQLLRPKNILEIGSGISYSTHWMLFASDDAQIYSIEQNKQRVAMCQDYFKRSKMSHRVHLINDWAEHFLETNNEMFDLIFFDCTKRSYITLLDPALRFLNKKGSIIADNIFCGGHVMKSNNDPNRKKYAIFMDKFNQSVKNNNQLRSFFFDIADGIALFQKIEPNTPCHAPFL